jgi:NADH:ubiquinone oxidoreductase subunit 6 (subunit J)
MVTGAVALGVIIYAMVATDWNVSSTPPLQNTTPELSNKLFGAGGFILPVEISAVLVLVAIVGAIVIARGKQK